MKDIKSYVIGFLTCACLFLIMGQTGSEKDADWDDIYSGKYKKEKEAEENSLLGKN